MWQPITYDEFELLLREQEAELSSEERQAFDRFRSPLGKATIRRSNTYGNEEVYVVARCDNGVLYFDDVEFGFNVSTIDHNGVILQPGGSQLTLAEAVRAWLMHAPTEDP